jgi:hypothetical protein
MPTYIVRLVADSSVRLSEKPYIETVRVPISVALSGLFTVTVVDNLLMMGDVNVPKGLVINVQLDADDLNSGIDHAQQAATYLLSMLSCVCNASVMQPKPLWAYDATPGLTERELTVFAYDLNIHMATRPVDKARLLTVLDHKLHGFMARDGIKGDYKLRLNRAVLSFRRGIADTEDTLDEFLIHWASLETLDVVYRHVFCHQPAYILRTCGGCKTTFQDCPVCGAENTLRVAQRHTGIEEVFAVLQQPEKYDELRKLRNGISHGYMSLSDCVATAGENVELVRKAVLTMILRIVGVGDDVQAAILKPDGLKGKYIPHFRVHAKGTFEPGDPCRYDTHPEVEVKCTELTFDKKDDMLVVHPTWCFTNKNCALTYTSYELWGDAAAKIAVTEDGTLVDVVKQSQESQPLA